MHVFRGVPLLRLARKSAISIEAWHVIGARHMGRYQESADAEADHHRRKQDQVADSAMQKAG